MPEPEAAADVIAAGAVVLRRAREVLLVHRPRYDDWSFAKGKLDPGEHEVAAAVREVAEETGLHIRLAAPLSPQRYPLANGRPKLVHYWVGRAVGDDDVSGYLVNDEIDAVAWVPVKEAHARLTYDYDRQTLAEALQRREEDPGGRRAPARRRAAAQALATATTGSGPCSRPAPPRPSALVPLLAAYDVTTLVSSSSLRCVDTLAAYAETTGYPLRLTAGLSEEEATKSSVDEIVEDLLDAGGSGCCARTGRCCRMISAALGLEKFRLEPGEMLVAHHRKGVLVALERHRPDPH